MGSSPVPSAGTTIPTPGQPLALQPGEWQGSASATVVNFKHAGINPPAELYVQTGDLLVISVTTLPADPDTVTVAVRLLLPVGPMPGQPDGSGMAARSMGAAAGMTAAQTAAAQASVSPEGRYGPPATIQQLVTTVVNSGGTTVTVKLPLQEGFLLSVTAVGSMSNGRGETFVRCWLQQRAQAGSGISVAMMMFADYVTQYAPIGWPGGRTVFPTEGPGYIYEISVGNPAVATDWSYTNPTTVRLRISSWSALFAASGTAGNRWCQPFIKTVAGVLVWLSNPSTSVPVSTTARVSASQSQVTGFGYGTTIQVPLPAPTILMPGETIGTVTGNITTGDQWSSIVIAAEAWLDNV
ncbi:MAG TPA: hypothetical protein VE779_08115 [Candidatus Angelobacter sp.]|nr:hypothetical protein [Candidatus Angelobacter sp.]